MPARVCLSMIVKNEAHVPEGQEVSVVERCLASARPFIDSWCIVDTGSTDGTQDVIRKFFQAAEIPGELHDRPWVNFGHNRTEALQLAGKIAEYALIVDADDILEADPGFSMPWDLSAPAYLIEVLHGGLRHWRPHLLRRDDNPRYEDVLHEYATCDFISAGGVPPTLEGLRCIIIGGGARSQDPRKFLRDAELLQRALKKEPSHARYAFYLAQSYKDAGAHVKALDAYERRVRMQNGFYEEVYISLLEIARLKRDFLHAPEHEVVRSHLRAYEYRPQRIESLVELARCYFRGVHERFGPAYLYSRAAARVRQPTDRLFIVQSYYDWMALDELAINAQRVGENEEGRRACLELLAEGSKLPESERARVEANLVFCEQGLGISAPKEKE